MRQVLKLSPYLFSLAIIKEPSTGRKNGFTDMANVTCSCSEDHIIIFAQVFTHLLKNKHCICITFGHEANMMMAAFTACLSLCVNA